MRALLDFRLIGYILLASLILSPVFQQSSIAESAEPKSESKATKTPKPLRKRILYLHAPWCKFCQRVKQESFPQLKKAKWKIGLKPTNHIQKFDTDNFPKLIEKYDLKLLPTYILIVDGKEVNRRDGYLSAFQIAELYYGRLKKKE